MKRAAPERDRSLQCGPEPRWPMPVREARAGKSRSRIKMSSWSQRKWEQKMGTEEQSHPLVGQDPETPGPGVQLSSEALAERNSGGCGREGAGK